MRASIHRYTSFACCMLLHSDFREQHAQLPLLWCLEFGDHVIDLLVPETVYCVVIDEACNTNKGVMQLCACTAHRQCRQLSI
jgi:hypothetical protein